MSTLLLQAHLLDAHGPRVDMPKLAEILNTNKSALYGKIGAGTLQVATYVEENKRWADFRDLAAYFDKVRHEARQLIRDGAWP